MKSTRSQMEAMGLVVVVILISLGALFFLQFSISKAGSSKASFTQKEIAFNTLNAFALTTTGCRGLDMTELVQDCTSIGAVDCNGMDSCSYMETVTSEILNRTLKEWGRKYNFTVVRGNNAALSISHGSCPGNKDSATNIIPSPDSGPKIYLLLDICN